MRMLNNAYLRDLIDFDLLRGTPKTAEDEYQTFVSDTLLRPKWLTHYIELGWRAELGELAQVLCKSLRPGYPIEKTWTNLISEMGDCLYWKAASVVAGDEYDIRLPDTEGYFTKILELIEKMGIDDPILRLYTLNREKLTQRKSELGSFTK